MKETVLPVASPTTFTIDQKVLADALVSISSALAKRSTLPILTNVKIEARHPFLTIAATNLEVYSKVELAAYVQSDGVFTVNYKELLDIIKPLKKSTLTLVAQEDSVLISGADMTVSLPTIDADEYPFEPSVKEENRLPESCVSLPVATFRQMVNAVYPAAAEDDTRPVFSGILFRLRQDVLTLVACDQHRLHLMRETLVGAGSWDRDLLLPARSLFEMVKRMPKQGEITLSSLSSAFATLTCGILTSHIREIEANYPRYEQIIPKTDDLETSLLVESTSLKAALLAIAPIAKDNSNIVRLYPHDGTLNVKAKRDGMVEPMSVLVSAATEGKELEGIYNYQYLIDVCSVAPASMLYCAWTTKHHASSLTLDRVPGFEAVVMQMDAAR